MRQFNCSTKTVLIKDSKIDAFEFIGESTESTIVVHMSSGKDYIFSTNEGSHNQITPAEFTKIYESTVKIKPVLIEEI